MKQKNFKFKKHKAHHQTNISVGLFLIMSIITISVYPLCRLANNLIVIYCLCTIFYALGILTMYNIAKEDFPDK